MSILSRIKAVLGFNYNYNRHKHTFDSNTIKKGEMKQLSDTEFIKNEKGRILHCKKSKSGKFKCIKTPIKAR